jgi:hypothetical protein
LSHKLLRSGDITDPDGPVSLGGGAGAGGAAMEGVDEAGGVVVLGVICPWGWPLGPTVFLDVR